MSRSASVPLAGWVLGAERHLLQAKQLLQLLGSASQQQGALMAGAGLQLELALSLYCGAWRPQTSAAVPSSTWFVDPSGSQEWAELCSLAADEQSWLSRLLVWSQDLRKPSDKTAIRGALFQSDLVAAEDQPSELIRLSAAPAPSLSDPATMAWALEAFVDLVRRHRATAEEY